MANKMFRGKIEIINHFDELINRVDIDIDESLKNYNENHVLEDLEWFDIKDKKRNIYYSSYLYLNKVDSLLNEDDDEYQTVELWSTKIADYLNQVRMTTIEELRKAQEETLENYKLNSARLKSLEEMSENKIEELRSQLFAEKFYFQIRLTTKNYKPWVFNLFTFVTDFYMSQSDIDILQ